MYEISKEFHFSASHCLRGVPEGHPCASLHGHNWVVEVILKGNKLEEETNFLIDYGELSFVKKWIDENLDHAHLCVDNKEAVAAENMLKSLGRKGTRTYVLGVNTCSENIAKEIHSMVQTEFYAYNFDCIIKIKETPKTTCLYTV